MVETKKTCSKCLKPKSSDSSGFITQYIAVCQCELNPSTSGPNICSTCGKSQQSARSGSLTQWILRSGKCNCIKPIEQGESKGRPLESNNAADQQELDIPSERFPRERYKPVAQLGTGASGTVYLATDRVLSKKVAVKILHQLDAEQLIQFQEEARTTSKLNHHNVIAILDFGPTDNGAPYMVLEYIEKAATLDQYIEEKGPLDLENAVRVFSDVCDGLAYAHEQGVFHRDLKPSNILLIGSDNLSAKLIDFGVAKVKEETQEPTIFQGRTIAGTAGYMAPEQTVGTSYTAQADIYSLGSVLFEALTGQKLFAGQTALETIAMQFKSPAPALSKLSQNAFPDEMDLLLAKCLARDPLDRFESADEVKAGLEEVVAATSRLIASESDTSLTRRRRQSHPLIIPIIVGLILLGGSTVMVQLWRLFDTTSTSFKINSNEGFSSLALPPKAAKQAESLKITTKTKFRENYHDTIANLDFAERAIVKKSPDGICYLEQCGTDDNLAAVKGAKDVIDLRVRNGLDIRGEGLAYLEGLPLRSLSIIPSAIDDQGLKYLPSLPQLSILSLNDSRIEGTTLRLLEKQPKLSALCLDKSELTDEGLRNLTGCKQLTELNVIGCKRITGSTLSNLKALPNLTSLDLSATSVKPEFLSCLPTFPKLTSLRIDALKLDRKSIEMLAKSGLHLISLKTVEITNEDIEFIIKTNKKLRILSLGYRSTPLRTIECLANSKLRTLTLEGIPLTHQDFEILSRSTNLINLHVPGAGITYPDASRLLSQKQLQHLTVSGPKLTNDQVRLLMKKFPRKRIQYEYINETDI